MNVARPLAPFGALFLLAATACNSGDDPFGPIESAGADSGAAGDTGVAVQPDSGSVTTRDGGTGVADAGAQTDGGVGNRDGGVDAGAQADAGKTDAGSQTDAGEADAGTQETDAGFAHFSFFVTSLKAVQALAGSQLGFGGDLRYGETGAGAGLRGADKICAAIAERSMPGSSSKQWHAFLSATAGENGVQVDAIDRIGNGPWYDRVGRLFANNKSELLYDRPLNANAAIKNDFPNEDGVPNHNPDLTGNVDNHDMLTGSGAQGRLYSSSATCKDWTTSDGSSSNGKPRVGHSWPRSGGGGGVSMANWISSLDEAGCAAAVYLIDDGGAKPGSNGVGSGGGYGGFYCFALVP